jgi:hypothetical protein
VAPCVWDVVEYQPDQLRILLKSKAEYIAEYD